MSERKQDAPDSLRRRSHVSFALALIGAVLPALIVFLLTHIARRSVFTILLDPALRQSYGSYFGAMIGITFGLLAAGLAMLILGRLAWVKGRAVGKEAKALAVRRPFGSAFGQTVGILAFIGGILILAAGTVLLLVTLIGLGVAMNIGN